MLIDKGDGRSWHFEQVAIADLVRDPVWQVRKELDPGAVARYAARYKCEAKMDPIEVAIVDGVPKVISGFHRLAALDRLGIANVWAEVAATTEAEGRWLAADANSRHGVPLKPGEQRARFRAYIATRQNEDRHMHSKSYREMAAELGIPKSTLARWTAEDFPKLAEDMGGTGHAQNPPKRDHPDAGLLVSLEAQVNSAIVTALGMKSEAARSAAVKCLERALAEVREGAPRAMLRTSLWATEATDYAPPDSNNNP